MVLVAGGLALTAAIVVPTYRWLDCGVSLGYARREQQYQRDRIEVLRAALRAASASGIFTRAALLKAVGEGGANKHVVNEFADRIEVDELVFRIRDQRVTDVLLLEEVDQGKREHGFPRPA